MIPEKVQQVLDRYALQAIEFEAGSTPTAPLAAQALGVAVGAIAKSLLLRGKNKKLFLTVVPGDKKISSSKLKALLETKIRMATPEETVQATGFHPGGVCPFGIEDIPVYLDQGLQAYETIYPAAGTDASGVPLTFTQLQEITAARVCDCTREV